MTDPPPFQSGSRIRTHSAELKSSPESMPVGRALTALVIDADRVSRRFVELALGAGQGFVVEAAKDGAAALEVLSTQLVDLIICETTLADMDGLQLFRRLKQEGRLRRIPFLILSSDRRGTTKVAALRSGVDDFLVKPCDATEFAARALAIVNREIQKRHETRHRSFSLAGDFTAVGFPELVSIIEMAQRSGILSVVDLDVSGRVFFDHGRVVHAIYGNIIGPRAFYRFVWNSVGQFEFAPGPCKIAEAERSISEPAMGLIMEAARQLDTERHHGLRAQREASVRPASLPAAPSAPRVAPTPLDARSIKHIETALRESFTLGLLHVFGEKELDEFTRKSRGRERFHIVLVSDIPAGVSAILPLASAPTERWVVESLAPGRKLLGLSFELRDERALDLVLVDARDSDSFCAALRRRPSALIFAPPLGDSVALGLHARIALQTLLAELTPELVVAVGQASLQDSLAWIANASPAAAKPVCLKGILGEAATELRPVLLRTLREWADAHLAQTEPANEGTG